MQKQPSTKKATLRNQRKNRKSKKTGRPSKRGEDIEDVSLWMSNFNLAVSDLAWSPDNLHFVSCATDSTICIWNVNENCKFW